MKKLSILLLLLFLSFSAYASEGVELQEADVDLSDKNQHTKYPNQLTRLFE